MPSFNERRFGGDQRQNGLTCRNAFYYRRFYLDQAFDSIPDNANLPLGSCKAFIEPAMHLHVLEVVHLNRHFSRYVHVSLQMGRSLPLLAQKGLLSLQISGHGLAPTPRGSWSAKPPRQASAPTLEVHLNHIIGALGLFRTSYVCPLFIPTVSRNMEIVEYGFNALTVFAPRPSVRSRTLTPARISASTTLHNRLS